MSDCCVIPHPGSPPTCPMNGGGTKPVGRKTVESLIRPEARTALTPQPYYFCNALDWESAGAKKPIRAEDAAWEASRRRSSTHAR